MNLLAPSVLPLLLAASSLSAQGSFLTSPSSLASSDGNQSLAFSEGTGTRWQQIHGDLIGPARLLLGLRLRRDEVVPALPTATSRQITVEVLAGEGDLALVGGDFAQNFLIPAQQVVPPTSITLPDWSLPAGGPLPFDLDVPFAVPFAYSGALALVVEVRIVNDSLVSHFVDSYAEAGNSVAPVDLGTGCNTGFLPFRQDASLTTVWVPTQRGELVWDLRALFAPVGLPGFFLVGTQNPVTVPGLCETVFPTLDLVLPATQFASGPIGINTVPQATTPFSPGLVGMQVTVQSAAIDPSQPVLPFVLSQAQVLTVAPLPPQPLPIVSLRGSLANALADEVVYGGRVLQFEF
jgi:hypothetical protein